MRHLREIYRAESKTQARCFLEARRRNNPFDAAGLVCRRIAREVAAHQLQGFIF
jgi:hypothetical protein